MLERPRRDVARACIGGVEVDSDEFVFIHGLPVAGGGSADPPSIPYLRRAWWAVPQRVPGTREVRALYGTVACGPQTAPASEHEALAHA